MQSKLHVVLRCNSLIELRWRDGEAEAEVGRRGGREGEIGRGKEGRGIFCANTVQSVVRGVWEGGR